MSTTQLIPIHGGYRKLKSFQVAQLAYDVTVRFCDLYIDRRSRTHDQMVQAARSGVQNIAEGSQAAGTSKKTELKLTNVARASLEELRLDYEDFLRQRELPLWPPAHPSLLRFKARHCATLADVRLWLQHELELEKTNTDKQGELRTVLQAKPSPKVLARPCSSAVPVAAQLVANATLSLLNLSCFLLDRQLASQAATFEKEGGFTERLYRVRARAKYGD